MCEKTGILALARGSLELDRRLAEIAVIAQGLPQGLVARGVDGVELYGTPRRLQLHLVIVLLQLRTFRASRRPLSARAARPSKPFLISMTPASSQIRLCAGTAILLAWGR